MRAADDFQSIRGRMLDLQRKPWVDPAACPGHVFFNGRCVHCNLHRFHLPALEQLKPPDADAGNLPCPDIGG